MISSDFYDIVQKASLPGIWSKGVALSRTDSVIEDSRNEDEIILRVRAADHPVSRKVTLWPLDEDWYCDCGAKVKVCPHIAAAVISLKSGKTVSNATQTLTSKSAQISYRFKRNVGGLLFERWIVFGTQKEELLTDSLVSRVGGISSGRITSLPIAATKEDYAVDAALGSGRQVKLDSMTLAQLFKSLAHCSNIQLDGQTVSVSPKPIQLLAQVTDEGSGFRIQQIKNSLVTESFKEAVALCGNVLRCIEVPTLTTEERALLSGDGKCFSGREVVHLVSVIIPSLREKISIEILSHKLPKLKQVPPRIVLDLEKLGTTDTLSVLPKLVYGTPHDPIHLNELFIADPIAEKNIIRKLQNELQLTPGHRVTFEGESAVEFCLRLKDWELSGDGVKAFSLSDTLTTSIQFQESGFQLSFESRNNKAQADPQRVLQAWRENHNYVPLLEGGWAPLPKDWLERFGSRIASLLEFKDSAQQLPSYLIPELTELCIESNQPYPESFKNLRTFLDHTDTIPEVEPPKNLKATLRHYQQKGLNWLCFLRDSKMGAMLADDMGLGKTLQALCAIQGRTLIIAPTSVLHGWANQIKQFRPDLSFSTYYGNQRKIDLSANIILTTYAILRLDREQITQINWDTIILDEAQVIKNPDSQIAKAAHLLRADSRIALSGTPIENRLDDLWSQFQFLNPGLLGTLESFQERFALPISKGNLLVAQQLKERIRPFILRRLKREVAPELPPRTETVLYCELSAEEKDVYDALLASTRQEVLDKLEAGGSVFAALELLLRLRQACCHVSLVPGQLSHKSSKIDLLIQTLENSIALGHRALIFSQWTSYLNLIEPHLKSNNITFSRLDGTTQNRQQIVEEFQTSTTSSVMLISLKAGGIGLTLTAADHVFLMDPWWNPTVEDQAADRTHRIGQKNPVLIHRLIAENTIEERILNLQKAKLELAASVLQDGSPAAPITRNDLIHLLN